MKLLTASQPQPDVIQVTPAVLRLQKTVLILETDEIEDIDSLLGLLEPKKAHLHLNIQENCINTFIWSLKWHREGFQTPEHVLKVTVKFFHV